MAESDRSARTALPSGELVQRIRSDNNALHDAPGYARWYDRHCGLIASPWERRRFKADLANLTARLNANPATARPQGSQPSPGPGSLAWDLAAGTGNLTELLLELGWNVLAVDQSPAMLEILHQRVARFPAGRVQSICLPVEDFLHSPPAHTAPPMLIVGCSWLHHLADWQGVVRLACRALSPAGAIYLAHEPLPPERHRGLAPWLARADFLWQRVRTRLPTSLPAYLPPDPGWKPSLLADYWTGPRGICPDQLERLLRNAGLRPLIFAYASCTTRLFHTLAQTLGGTTLLRAIAHKPPPPAG